MTITKQEDGKYIATIIVADMTLVGVHRNRLIAMRRCVEELRLHLY